MIATCWAIGASEATWLRLETSRERGKLGRRLKIELKERLEEGR